MRNINEVKIRIKEEREKQRNTTTGLRCSYKIGTYKNLHSYKNLKTITT